MPQRASRASTRRDNCRSGVARAQVIGRPSGVRCSRLSRIIRATAVAASSSARTDRTVRPDRPSAMGSAARPASAERARRRLISARQSSVASAGRRASLIRRWRARPRASTAGSSGGWNHGWTASRPTSARASRACRAACGCWSSMRSQASAARSRSRPGSTTTPCGALATAFSTSAAAGTVPVEPAAMTGACGGRASHASARRRSRVARRHAGSTSPSASRRLGQASTARPRKRALSRQCSARSCSARIAMRDRSDTSSS